MTHISLMLSHTAEYALRSILYLEHALARSAGPSASRIRTSAP
jgi:hypothetical protein